MDIATVFRNELSPDERVLWSGQPRQGFMLRPTDVFLIPFTLLWGGFAIFWEATVVISGAPVFFMLWGIPFVLVGLYITVGRFFLDTKQREKTHYAVTNERVIILSGLFGHNVRSLSLKALSDINVNAKENGRGTITFGQSHPLAGWYAGLAWPGLGRNMAPTFEMIEGAKQVYELIRRVQRNQ